MKGTKPNGYTVLELMIVIAVSASMFVAVAIAFGGRQQQIQFTQAVRDLDARILDIVNDISTGYYNNTGTLNCSVIATNPNARPLIDGSPAALSTADQQGSSDDCVNIGKAIQFAPLLGATQQPDVINIYNIVGRRNNGGATANDLEMARPMAVAPADAGDTYFLDGQVSKIPLQYGLEVTKIFNGAGLDFGTIGFFTSFSKTFITKTTEDVTLSNNQSVAYGVIPGTSLNQTMADAVTIINTITDEASAPTGVYVDTDGNGTDPVSGDRIRQVTICLRSADGRRKAAIVIGADGVTTTQVQFDNYDEANCV